MKTHNKNNLFPLLAKNIMSKNIKLKPEALECVCFFQEIIALALEGKLKGMFTHVANEIPSKNNIHFHLVQKYMGKISGFADYIFFKHDKTLLIEFKSDKGKLSPDQKRLQEWAEAENIPFSIVRSKTEALNLLKQHGFLS